MFFLRQHQKNLSAFTLQTHRKKHTDHLFLIFPRIRKRKQNNCQPIASKRASSVISIISRGSLTIEAALIIPIFLFAIMALLSFTDILRLQMKMDSVMSQCARELAIYGYAENALLSGDSKDLPLSIETLFSETYVRNRIISELGSDYLTWSPAGGSQGIHFIGSRIMEQDRIELYSTYYVTPFFTLSPKAGFLTGQSAVARAFTGYDNLSAGDPAQKEECVYITPTGKAYHRKRNCHYLDLSIEKVFEDELASLRNEDGGIYYSCPLCGDTGGKTVFITSYGDKYHKDVLCSGLKRTVEMIPISQVGNRTPCPKCS